MTRHFRIIYEKIDTREVWIEVPGNGDEHNVERMFMNDFTRYDDESDDHDNDAGTMNILDITEIDKEGNEI